MKKQQVISIMQLYPRDMNIYGDWGNVLALKRRLEWRGFSVELIEYNVGDSFPENIDIIIGGGGQDSGQLRICDDLRKIAPRLKRLDDDDLSMLAICGLYQLFGHNVITKDGEKILGIGILDLKTIGSDERIVGNIILKSPEFGEIIGYENHSGLTTLGHNATALGDRNVIGTYLHGPLLPKNPHIADWLISQAVIRKYGAVTLEPLDDKYIESARNIAKKRPR